MQTFKAVVEEVVAERLTRLEVSLENLHSTLAAHTELDDRNFRLLSDKIDKMMDLLRLGSQELRRSK